MCCWCYVLFSVYPENQHERCVLMLLRGHTHSCNSQMTLSVNKNTWSPFVTGSVRRRKTGCERERVTCQGGRQASVPLHLHTVTPSWSWRIHRFFHFSQVNFVQAAKVIRSRTLHSNKSILRFTLHSEKLLIKSRQLNAWWTSMDVVQVKEYEQSHTSLWHHSQF